MMALMLELVVRGLIAGSCHGLMASNRTDGHCRQGTPIGHTRRTPVLVMFAVATHGAVLIDHHCVLATGLVPRATPPAGGVDRGFRLRTFGYNNTEH